MKKYVPPSLKRNFLQWFLSQFRLRNPTVKILLDFVMEEDSRLEWVKFTDKPVRNRRTLIASTYGSDIFPFQWVMPGKSTYQVQEAFHILQQKPYEPLYLLLHFREKALHYRYQQVVETPTLQDIGSDILHQLLSEMETKRKKREERLQELEQLIDTSLHQGDESSFLLYTKELNQLQKEAGD